MIGLAARGFYQGETYTSLRAIEAALNSLALLSARLAEIARRELAGEEISYEDLYWLQENFGQQLWSIRYMVEEWVAEPPDNVALVADVASNASAGVVCKLPGTLGQKGAKNQGEFGTY